MATARSLRVMAALLSSFALVVSADHARAQSIPAVETKALDGRNVTLPKDLSTATVLILGFSRRSADATTAWEKPARARFDHAAGVTFYDIAMLAEVPHFARGFVIGRVRKAVPDILKPNFLVLTDHEPEWKQVAGYDPAQQDAAYIMLVDHNGAVRWSTHAAFTAALFDQLALATQALAGK